MEAVELFRLLLIGLMMISGIVGVFTAISPEGIMSNFRLPCLQLSEHSFGNTSKALKEDSYYIAIGIKVT